VERVALLHEETARSRQVTFVRRYDPSLPPILGDEDRLLQVFHNLLTNALDAMRQGGRLTLATRVSLSPLYGKVDVGAGQRAMVEAAVADEGAGISAAIRGRIFDPFFTTKEVGKGTGLGLSQVYGFAHQAGGTVRAESKVGHGTLFRVYLPLCSERLTAAREPSPIDVVQAQRPTVLVVDDSAEVAQVTSALFEHLGYNTVYRDSAEAALKVLAGGASFDLVFSDIVMPGAIDGVGLAREIRARYPDLPVILTTGYSDAAQAAPADLPILRKPFDTDALRGFIHEAVETGAWA
jgi:CheY-like chemotaxis protein